MTVLTGLPRIDPAEAQLRGDLLAALNGIEAERAVLTATLPPAPPRLNWFACAEGFAFAIERLEGAPLHLQAADGVCAAESLERAEPILRAIEWALDIELEPETLAPEPPGGEPLWVAVAAANGTRVLLAIPRDLALVASPAPLAPRLLDPVPVPATLALAGPRLAPIEAADLAQGDLLLLGDGPLRATLAFLDRAPVAGRFEPAARRFTPLDATQE